MSRSCLMHSSIGGHMGCFHTLLIVNNAAMNKGVLMFSWTSVLYSFIYIPKSGIAGSKGRSIFNFLKYLHTAFHSSRSSLHSHQQCKRIPFSPHSPQHLFVDLLFLLIISYWLCCYNCPDSPFCPPPPSAPYFLRQSPYHYLHPWVMCISPLTTPFPMPYFLHPHGYSITTYLYFLIPSPLHLFSPSPLPSVHHLVTNFFLLLLLRVSLYL